MKVIDKRRKSKDEDWNVGDFKALAMINLKKQRKLE